MKKELLKTSNWVAGVQWLFFIFANIVIIPLTVGAAFDLSQEKIAAMLQLSFAITGVACILQALLGHKRAIMEVQSGLCRFTQYSQYIWGFKRDGQYV